ncbi:MAG: carboxymuconolactone decarboxylase family protein [Deltaproteobacteria bacterium]|nr:carboxymuconolactone decarboxylase family protein [Deltaproteobacteria bacterium]MBW2070270.1 carboxymuconolactone decarboxylase family protein [Deltaproteobacteria bacterium]
MYLPKPYQQFKSQYPEVARLYEELGVSCQSAGPLEGKVRYLVNLGVAVGAGSPGAVKSHARKALEQGATREEIYHALLLALTTVGFPAMIAAIGWVEEVFAASSS